MRIRGVFVWLCAVVCSLARTVYSVIPSPPLPAIQQKSWKSSSAPPTLEHRLPQAIVIGVKKAGTRALLEFLRLNPNVRAPGPEVHFFDRHFDRGLDWYRRQMPLTTVEQMTVEKTPRYFITKAAPERVYRMDPSVKLLVVVRDPVTRAISDYTQTATKRADMPSFETIAFNGSDVNTSWGAIKIGVYHRHVRRWLNYFPLSQIHFVSGERLIRDPATELQRVEQFLGLASEIRPEQFHLYGAKGFPCLRKTRNADEPHCLGKTKGRSHPDLSEQVFGRLRQFYRPHNEKFYKLVGQNFGW